MSGKERKDREKEGEEGGNNGARRLRRKKERKQEDCCQTTAHHYIKDQKHGEVLCFPGSTICQDPILTKGLALLDSPGGSVGRSASL